jgi:hypothetical protein
MEPVLQVKIKNNRLYGILHTVFCALRCGYQFHLIIVSQSFNCDVMQKMTTLFYQVRQGHTWSRNYKSPSPSPPSDRFRISSF